MRILYTFKSLDMKFIPILQRFILLLLVAGAAISFGDLTSTGKAGVTARDIGELYDTCDWLNHMIGVDETKPGAQE
jgi:hypothetical protein